MKNIVVLFTITLLFSAGNILSQSKKELKKEQKQAEYKAVKNLIEEGIFDFEAHWAANNKGQRTQLTAGYKISFNHKSTIADLPFFGQAHLTSHALNDGIKFSNVNTNLDIKYNDKKTKISVKFKAISENKSEHFNINLSILSNGNASLSVSSTSRSYMSYTGIVREFIPESENTPSLLGRIFARKKE